MASNRNNSEGEGEGDLAVLIPLHSVTLSFFTATNHQLLS